MLKLFDGFWIIVIWFFVFGIFVVLVVFFSVEYTQILFPKEKEFRMKKGEFFEYFSRLFIFKNPTKQVYGLIYRFNYSNDMWVYNLKEELSERYFQEFDKVGFIKYVYLEDFKEIDLVENISNEYILRFKDNNFYRKYKEVFPERELFLTYFPKVYIIPNFVGVKLDSALRRKLIKSNNICDVRKVRKSLAGIHITARSVNVVHLLDLEEGKVLIFPRGYFSRNLFRKIFHILTFGCIMYSREKKILRDLLSGVNARDIKLIYLTDECFYNDFSQIKRKIFWI